MSAFPAYLVVDDETDIRELLLLTLERMDIRADSTSTLAEARHLLEQGQYGLCLTDMRLPDGSGLDLVKHIAQDYPWLPVALITAYGSAENSVSALKLSSADLTNPAEDTDSIKLIGNSTSIRQVRSMIEKLSRSQVPVYISGESGSGKELAVRLIHQNGSRRDDPFIAVNCGAFPENLMESEFFSHKKGSFTGATQDKEGMFHPAKSGMLFLDEVADLPLAIQIKAVARHPEKSAHSRGCQGRKRRCPHHQWHVRAHGAWRIPP